MSMRPWSCIVYLLAIAAASAQQAGYQGIGCTTAFHIDKDCDGYGVGTAPDDPSPLLGPDADDNDATVHTAAQAKAKYSGGTAASDGLSLFLAHLGYTPAHYYFVSTSGNNSTGAVDDPSRPFATITGVRAAHALTSDDIVLVHGGTYTDNWSLMYPSTSGTSGHPVIFMAYPGEHPLWDLAGDFGGDVTYGNSNLVFDGINFTNSATGLGRTFFMGADSSGVADHITIRNLEVYSRTNGVFAMQALTNWLIEDNVLRDTATSHNIYVGARDRSNSNITVRENVFYRPGLTCAQHNGRITNYILEGNICHSFSGASGFSLEQGVSDSFVRNNLVFNGQRQPFAMADYPTPPDLSTLHPYSQTGNLIENNTFVAGQYRYQDGTEAASPMENVKIELGLDWATETGGGVTLQPNTFRNNIFYNSSAAISVIHVNTYSGSYTCAIAGGCTGSDYMVFGAVSPVVID